MTDAIVGATISFSVGAFLLVLLYVCWRSYQLDSFRDKLFALREELFLYVCDNDMVDHPAHGFLRDEINSFIRYAHKITVWRLGFLIGARDALRVGPSSMLEEWKSALELVPAGSRDKMRYFHEKSLILMTRHLVASSLILRPVAAVIGSLRYGRMPSKSVMDSYANSQPVRLMEADAMWESRVAA
jgi:hypothetical protein